MCCLLNLWLIADSGVVIGIAMTKEEASTHMNRLMLAACVGMVLRFIAVYLPSWSVAFLQSLSTCVRVGDGKLLLTLLRDDDTATL